MELRTTYEPRTNKYVLPNGRAVSRIEFEAAVSLTDPYESRAERMFRLAMSTPSTV